MIFLLCLASSAARADCPAVPIGNPDDMAISFLRAHGVQAASASLLASSVKEGTLVYDDTATKLKICDGTNWVDVGSGSGTDTLAALSCAAGQIAKFNGTAWTCAADGGGSGGSSNPVAFSVNKNGTNQTVTSGAEAVISWSTEDFDTNNNFASNRFTPTAAGKYLITLSAYAPNGVSFARIYKNSTKVTEGYNPGSNAVVPATVIVDMNGTTDYIEGRFYTTGSTTLEGLTNHTYMSGFLIGGGSDTLTGLSCSANQIPKWSGTAWACAADGGGSGTPNYMVKRMASTWAGVTAATVIPYNTLVASTGTKITQSGNQITVEPGSYILTANIRATNITNEAADFAIYNVTTSAFVGTTGSVSEGANTDVSAIAFVSPSVSTTYEARTTGVAGTVDFVNAYSSFSAAELGGGAGADTLAGLSCSTNQIPKWNGTAWACATDDAGSSSSTEPPRFSVYRSGNQTVTTNLPSKILFNTEEFDSNNNFDTATGRFTPTVAGTYLVLANSYCPDATTWCQVRIYRNGSEVVESGSYGSIDLPTTTALVSMNGTTDYVEAYAYNGGGTTVGGAAQWTRFSGFKLGGGGGSATSNLGYLQLAGSGSTFVDSGTAAGQQLFWDNTNKRLGIGTTTPDSLLTLASDTFTESHLYSGSATGNASFVAYRSRGTHASPTAVTADDYFGSLIGRAYDGSAYANSAAVRFAIDGTVTTGGLPSRITLHTADTGTTALAERVRINSSGAVSIGSAASAAASSLLDLTSTTRGLLPPRMTTVQRDAIATPATGLMIFNTTAAQYQFWNGTAWSGLGSGGVPTGTIAAFALTTCPSGWTEYTAARGRFLRGIDNGAGNDPEGTRAPGNTQTDDIKSHLHSVNPPSTATNSAGAHSHDYNRPNITASYRNSLEGGSNGNQTVTAGAATSSEGAHAHTVDIAAFNSESTGITETRPKNVAVLFCQYSGSGGGGGSTTLAGLTDVDVSALANGKVLTYNSTTSKWEATTPSGGGTPAPSNGYVQFNNSGAFGGDANLFWDNTNKRLGIGTTTPVTVFDIVTNATSGWGVRIAGDQNKERFAIESATPVFQGSHYRGTLTAKTATQLGDVLTYFQGGGHDGTNQRANEARMRIVATENHSPTNQGTAVDFQTTPNGFPYTSIATRMTINHDGNVGIGTTAPTANLTISANTAVLPAPQAGTMLHIGSADATNGIVTLDSFGSAVNVNFRATNGTAVSPSPILAGNGLGNIVWQGRGATSYITSSAVKINAVAEENWTDASAAAALMFSTRPTGSVSASTERMRITGAGNVGIGTTTPEANLVAVASTTAPSRGIMSSQYNDGVQAPLFIGKKARGTLLAPTAVMANDYTVALQATGYNGTAFSSQATTVASIASENWTTTANGYYTVLHTTPNTTIIPQERLRIDQNGNVGIGTASPKQLLDINGVITTPGVAMNGYFDGTWRPKSAGHLGYIQMEASTGKMYFWNSPTSVAADAASSLNARMAIDKDGNVGIGTATPAGKLHVSPGSSTKETVIDGWDAVNADIDTLLPGTVAGSLITGPINAHMTFALRDNDIDDGFYFLTTNASYGTNNAYDLMAMSIKSNGNVGIGTAVPSYKLHVVGQVAGNAAYVNTSDARLKKDVADLDYGLATVMRLHPVSFQWRTQDEAWQKGRKLGLIAQEVEKLVPEVVTTANDKPGTKSIAYGDLTPVLIKAVHELKAANDNLKADNDNQDAAIEELRREINALKAAQ